MANHTKYNHFLARRPNKIDQWEKNSWDTTLLANRVTSIVRLSNGYLCSISQTCSKTRASLARRISNFGKDNSTWTQVLANVINRVSNPCQVCGYSKNLASTPFSVCTAHCVLKKLANLAKIVKENLKLSLKINKRDRPM
jgi:hypothetical protein